MNRVIVCKLGRFGELRKIVDCQTNQLSEGKSDEQNTQNSQSNGVIVTNDSQSNSVVTSDSQSNSFVTSDCLSNSLVTSESQYSCSVSSDSHLTSQMTQGGFGSFVFNMNQNFEDCIFEIDMGQPSLTAPHQTEVRSPDALQHFLNNFTTNNAETAPTLNKESLFGSKTVKEKNPRSCLELLKHLKPAKTVENKTKSPELMKYLAPISPECIEISLPVIHFENPTLKHKSAEVVIPENSQVSEKILHSDLPEKFQLSKSVKRKILEIALGESVNLMSCSGTSTSTWTISTATSNESTASKLPAYGHSLSHPMKTEQAGRDAEATMISSNYLNLVSLGLGDQLGDGSSLSLSSSGLFTNCPSLSSLTASIEQCGTRDESGISKKKLSYQPDVRRIGGGKLISGRNLGITDAGKLVQLRLVETGQLHPSQNTSSSQISSPSPSLSASSPASPDTQQCSSTTYTSSISQGSIKDEDDCPKRSCLVCGDVASGFHYGVSSCEACKAFFKRTIQGNIDYTCPVASSCEINKRRRKACQACRYQKCLRQGMLKEGVRLNRVRGGRQKYKRYPMETTHGSVQMNIKVTLEENKVLESLSQCEPEQLVSLADPSLSSSALKTVSTLSDIYDRELVGTIGWAKQVPGFTDLTLNDQMKLLQSSWTEVLTLTLVYRSLPKLRKLNFASDFSLNEAEASECGLEHFFEKCMLIVERMERLGIAREEFLILKALVMANSDCQLEEFSAIGQLRENLLSSLHDAVYFIRCGDANLQLQSLLLILPSLRDADTVLRTFWSKIKQDGQVPMNKLLIEMLEA